MTPPKPVSERLAAARTAAEALHADVRRIMDAAMSDKKLPRSWVYVARALSRIEGAAQDLGVAAGDAAAADEKR